MPETRIASSSNSRVMPRPQVQSSPCDTPRRDGQQRSDPRGGLLQPHHLHALARSRHVRGQDAQTTSDLWNTCSRLNAEELKEYRVRHAMEFGAPLCSGPRQRLVRPNRPQCRSPGWTDALVFLKPFSPLPIQKALQPIEHQGPSMAVLFETRTIP